jgi:hypothetical protein
MAKFDFNNSRYAKFFSDKSNRRFLSTFINQEGILLTNYGWYKTQGMKADGATPQDNKGNASFTVKARTIEAAPLMDLRAPLTDTNQKDENGIGFYTASIPDFSARGIVENAMEREYRTQKFEDFGNDADIVATWVGKVQEMLNSADTTLNNLTGQLLSKGNIDYTGLGSGIQLPLHKAAIPTDNFTTAGTKVWTANDCQILTQMKAIESKYRDKWGYEGALIWQIPRKMYHDVLMKNSEVINFVNSYRNANIININGTNVSYGDALYVTAQLFNDALSNYEGISPIEVVTEQQRNLTNTGDATIHGWSENVAVLRPAGYACEFEYCDNLDQKMFTKYGASVIDKTFATINDGLCTLINTTLNNGTYKEWHTDLLMKAVPALIDFPYHVIVNTTTAS